jgi:hypothetical protein
MTFVGGVADFGNGSVRGKYRVRQGQHDVPQDRIVHDAACHLPARVSSHSIGDEPKAMCGVAADRIFVGVVNPAGMTV